MDKKHLQSRGTSASANKAPHSFAKPSYTSHVAGGLFSPDKRADVSRGQGHNNLYYKRGLKTTGEGKREVSKGGH